MEFQHPVVSFVHLGQPIPTAKHGFDMVQGVHVPSEPVGMHHRPANVLRVSGSKIAQ